MLIQGHMVSWQQAEQESFRSKPTKAARVSPEVLLFFVRWACDAVYLLFLISRVSSFS